jgi:hypothetical protein
VLVENVWSHAHHTPLLQRIIYGSLWPPTPPPPPKSALVLGFHLEGTLRKRPCTHTCEASDYADFAAHLFLKQGHDKQLSTSLLVFTVVLCGPRTGDMERAAKKESHNPILHKYYYGHQARNLKHVYGLQGRTSRYRTEALRFSQRRPH